MKFPFGLIEPFIISAMPALIGAVTGEIPEEHKEKLQLGYCAVAMGGDEVKKYLETSNDLKIDDALWAKLKADAQADMEAQGCPHLFAELDTYIQIDAL